LDLSLRSQRSRPYQRKGQTMSGMCRLHMSQVAVSRLISPWTMDHSHITEAEHLLPQALHNGICKAGSPSLVAELSHHLSHHSDSG
jgi:hypothetical protein